MPPMAAASTVPPVTTSSETAGLKTTSQVGVYQKREKCIRVRFAPLQVTFAFALGCVSHIRPLKMATSPSLPPFSVAAGSRGAYLHSGVAVALERCTLAGNKAGDEGLAVLSPGTIRKLSDVVFDSNTFYCTSRTYGYEMDVSEAEVRHCCILWSFPAPRGSFLFRNQPPRGTENGRRLSFSKTQPRMKYHRGEVNDACRPFARF